MLTMIIKVSSLVLRDQYWKMDTDEISSPNSGVHVSVHFSSFQQSEMLYINLNHQTIQNETSTELSEHQTVSDAVSYFVGFIMTTVFIFGVVENSTVLIVYGKNSKIRNVNNAFIVGLCLSDFGQTVFNIPLVIIACFSKRWIFGHKACLYIGYVTTFFGISQISLLCIIAAERYFIIIHQSRKLSATQTKACITILCCFLYGASWALGPLLGWSEYSPVAGEISCSIKWTSNNTIYLSYTLALFSFAWLLPLSVITFAYICIANMIFRERSKRDTMKLSQRQRKLTKEYQVAVTIFIMISAFVISWTPYSIVALFATFGNIDKAPSAVYLAPAVFAKASIIWNPLIYTARHREFRIACEQVLPSVCFKSSVHNRSTEIYKEAIVLEARTPEYKDLSVKLLCKEGSDECPL